MWFSSGKINTTSDWRGVKSSTIYYVDRYKSENISYIATSYRKLTSYRTTENIKDETRSLGFVYSSNPEEYPENGTKEEILQNGESITYYYQIQR